MVFFFTMNKLMQIGRAVSSSFKPRSLAAPLGGLNHQGWTGKVLSLRKPKAINVDRAGPASVGIFLGSYQLSPEK